jgi:hypothetical protein
VAEAVYGSGDFTTTEQEETYRMARIQVLTLPSKTVGDNVDYPFAIVIDEVDHEKISSYGGDTVRTVATELIDKTAIAEATGAVGVIVVAGTLYVA